MIQRFGALLRRNVAALWLITALLLLSSAPFLDIHFAIGDAWRGVMPTFTDELNFARLSTIGDGHLTDGNAYFLEHADGPPLVLFGGAWLNAVPLWLGLPMNATLFINFLLWTLLFGLAAYAYLLSFGLDRRLAAVAAGFLYVQSYWHVWRTVNLQPVFPFYFLWYTALFRFWNEQSRSNIIFLGVITGLTFYVFAFLWQIAVATLGLFFLYSLWRRDWGFMRSVLLASFIGGCIGVPVPAYMLWLGHASPYFWESMVRLGLVYTHLPMAEVVYSGGWIGVLIASLASLWYLVPRLRDDGEFKLLGMFFCITGLALWIMQGSNLITGRLLETAEHVRTFIFPLLLTAQVVLGSFLWRRRAIIALPVQVAGLIVMAALFFANLSFAYESVQSFIPTRENRAYWQSLQPYAAPLQWLDDHESESVVVWSDPKDALAAYVPIYTKHFTLYQLWGVFELMPTKEGLERFLVSQYFDDPSLEELKNIDTMAFYLGRADYMHNAKTKEREVKVCRLLSRVHLTRDCGTPPTAQQLLGDAYFENLEQQLQTQIRPNIADYLKKYHVRYILKDKVRNPSWRPETLAGTAKIYEDERYELYSISY